MTQSLSPDLSRINDLIRYEIFIPIADNDGKLFDGNKFLIVTDQLMETFGGVTIDFPYGGSGGVDGRWLESITKILYRDRIAVFMALSSATPLSQPTMTKMQKKWEKVFKQEKILILAQRLQAL